MNVAKRGAWCSVPKCPTNVNKNVVCEFFSFPKNPQLATQWVLKIGRKDLLQKDPAGGFPGCKICSKHFEDKVFANSAKTALRKNAIPTIFRRPLSLHQATKAQTQRSAECHSVEPPIVISSPETSMEEPFSPLQDPLMLPSDIEPHVIPEVEQIDEDVVEVGRKDDVQQTVVPQFAILWPLGRRVETVEVGSQADPGDEVLALRQEVEALRNQISDLETGSNMGFPELISLARKLLPLHVAEFVEAQCTVGNRRADNKTYSTDFIKFASTLYALGPKAYAYMMRKFRLPTVRLLQVKSRR